MGPEIVIAIAGSAAAIFFWRHLTRHRAQQAARVPHAADLEVALHLAYHLAKTHQQRLVDPPIIACALLQDEEIAQLLETCGWDAEALSDSLGERRFTDDAPTTRVQAGWGLSRAVEDALLRATTRAAAAERAEIDCRDVFSDLLVGEHEDDESLLYATLRDAGVDVDGLLYSLVHGRPDKELEAPEVASGCRVILHNDDITVMEFVVSVLRRVFELAEEEAVQLMLRVHAEGRASCGTWPAARAVDLANKARAIARGHGFPLRFAVAPADGAPEETD